MTLRPLSDRVVLKRKETDETTPSGLFVPAAARQKSNLAVVVAVGAGRVADDGTVRTPTIEEGQTVLIGQWSGDIVQVDDVEHLIVRESDILAVVD